MTEKQYSSTNIPMQSKSSNNDANAQLLGDNVQNKPAITKYKSIILVLSLISIGAIIASIVLAIKLSNSSTSSSSKFDTGKPKNLIVMIGDGMGTSYNAAYRIYKNRTFNPVDKYFKGRYSTNPTNSYPYGITDSAAGAVPFAAGVQTQNAFLGVDSHMNPVGSILAAAKRQGKGTGIISTKSVTDATPAAFNSHTIWRRWNELISHQQMTRQINNKPMTDIIFGGGRQYFHTLYDNTLFWNDSNIWKDTYGWNKLVDNYEQFMNLSSDSDDIPVLGLFSHSHFPYYLDRINSNENDIRIPDLLEMSKKAIELLDSKYGNKNGYFLMIEGSKIDSCGHDNDIVCMLWEMEEFEKTIEYVMDYAQNDSETLVIILADHETGGLSIGRDASLQKENVVTYQQGTMPRDWDIGGISTYWGEFMYSMEMAPPKYIRDTIENIGLYKFYPYDIQFAKHTAEWIENKIDDMILNGTTNVSEVYTLIEENYLGNIYSLTQQEKIYINNTWLNEPSENGRELKYTPLMNARCLSGWTTHQHTGADISLYAYGPSQNRFSGHFTNYEIGILMSDIFGVVKEQNEETEWLREQFINGVYPKLCDENIKPPYVEWNVSVVYSDGNILANQYCVEQWIS
eukprot:402202_1